MDPCSMYRPNERLSSLLSPARLGTRGPPEPPMPDETNHSPLTPVSEVVHVHLVVLVKHGGGINANRGSCLPLCSLLRRPSTNARTGLANTPALLWRASCYLAFEAISEDL